MMDNQTDKEPLLNEDENKQPEDNLIVPIKKGCKEGCFVKIFCCCFYVNYDLTYDEKKTMLSIKNSLGRTYNDDQDEEVLNNLLTLVRKEYQTRPSTSTLDTDLDVNTDQIWVKIGFQVSIIK